MSNADCLKERIDWLKTVVSLGTALLMSLVSWLVQNYEIGDRLFVVIATVLTGFMMGIIISAAFEIHRCIRQLETS
jgi:hypothetical protein